MNSDILKGKWSQLKGQVKQKWAKLTDEDVTFINGKAEELSGILQERYGYDKERAKKEVDEFLGKH